MLHHTSPGNPGLFKEESKTGCKSKSPPTKDPEPSTSQVHGWLEDYHDPSTRSSGKKQEWGEVDSAMPEKAFKNYPSLPKTAVVRGVPHECYLAVWLLDQANKQNNNKKMFSVVLSCRVMHMFVNVLCSSHSSPTLSWLRGLCALMTLRALPGLIAGQTSKGTGQTKGATSSS